MAKLGRAIKGAGLQTVVCDFLAHYERAKFNIKNIENSIHRHDLRNSAREGRAQEKNQFGRR